MGRARLGLLKMRGLQQIRIHTTSSGSLIMVGGKLRLSEKQGNSGRSVKAINSALHDREVV